MSSSCDPDPGIYLQATKQVTVSEKKLKVAINGFGRIGRNFLRCWNGRSSSLLDVVAINDSGGVKQVRSTNHPAAAAESHPMLSM